MFLNMGRNRVEIAMGIKIKKLIRVYDTGVYESIVGGIAAGLEQSLTYFDTHDIGFSNSNSSCS